MIESNGFWRRITLIGWSAKTSLMDELTHELKEPALERPGTIVPGEGNSSYKGLELERSL